MSEALAGGLGLACRTALLCGIGGLFTMYVILLLAQSPADVPFTCIGGARFILFMSGCIGASLLLGVYLTGALGVDVFGVNRLLGIPRGRPFGGLAPGEQERLRLRWVHGGIGFSGGLGFKVLLTDQRLLAGSTLSSWYLLEIPLAEVERVERPSGLLFRTALRFRLRDGRHHDLRLARPADRERLAAALSHGGTPLAIA